MMFWSLVSIRFWSLAFVEPISMVDTCSTFGFVTVTMGEGNLMCVPGIVVFR